MASSESLVHYFMSSDADWMIFLHTIGKKDILQAVANAWRFLTNIASERKQLFVKIITFIN